MKVSLFLSVTIGLIALSLPACERMHAEEKEQAHEEHQAIVVTGPKVKDVTVTTQYVCQIRSKRNTEIRALEEGYLEAITINEGQAVDKEKELFRIVPVLYKAKLDAERAEVETAQAEVNATQAEVDATQAEVDAAQIEYDQTRRLASAERPVVSQTQVALDLAKLNKAKGKVAQAKAKVEQAKAKVTQATAKVAQAQAELNFTVVKAPFAGIIDRLYQMEGSLVGKGDLLTTLSDNSTMWVYFNVPEARYLEYKTRHGQKGPGGSQHLRLADSTIELVLADGSTFPYPAADDLTIEGKFNNETGNIPFRADFPNPDRLLRHGQTGNILIHRTVKDALVIPQRATFPILDKRFVFVVGEDNVVHQREITVQYEMDDVYVIKSGLGVNERIVLEGLQQARDGHKIEFEVISPDEALKQKQRAE